MRGLRPRSPSTTTQARRTMAAAPPTALCDLLVAWGLEPKNYWRLLKSREGLGGHAVQPGAHARQGIPERILPLLPLQGLSHTSHT